MASSDSVTSMGVPNTVVVERNDSVPPGVMNLSGTTMPPYSACAAPFTGGGPG